MRVLPGILLVLLAASAGAQPVMTTFDPGRDGLLFNNQFKNQFTRDIQTAGLCGGMMYTTLDYLAATDRPRPAQWFRPNEGTALRQYIYDRNVDQITSNIDRWAEFGANPGGARSSEYFSWGIDTSPEGQVAKLRASIDRNEPIPIGMQGCGPSCCGPNGDKCSGNHVVLAIGYETGPQPRDLKIFVYDPNAPREVRTLVPRPDSRDGGPFFTYLEGEGRVDSDGVAFDSRWLTYFVDVNYSPRRPPLAPRITYPSDGKVHALVLHFQTGEDDLRGGRVDLTIETWDGREFSFPNVNLSKRWLSESTESVLVEFGEGIERDMFERITINTNLAGGVAGDNWDLQRLVLDVLPTVGDRRLIRFPAVGDYKLKRFTGDAKTWTSDIMPSPLAQVRRPTTLDRGFDRPGYDYRRFEVANGQYRQGCQQVCDRDSQCKAWTYVTSSRVCWLKNELPPKVRNAGTISGIKLSLVAADQQRSRSATPPRPPARPATPLFPATDRTTLERNTNRPGYEYRAITIRGGAYRQGCQRVCEQDGRCKAWTYTASDGRCSLKDGLPSKQRSTDAVSGIRMSLIREDLNR